MEGLLVILVIGAICAVALIEAQSPKRRRWPKSTYRPNPRWRGNSRSSAGDTDSLIEVLPRQPAPAQPAEWTTPLSHVSNPKVQMDAVATVDFERVPLLNREEARLLPLLEQCVKTWGKGHRLMAQVALGELIRPRGDSGTEDERRRGYASVNSKRLDFAIIDRRGLLIVAVEYQGSGHYHANSFMRDAVKREALRKAGVAVIEISAGYQAEEVKGRIRSLLDPAPASA